MTITPDPVLDRVRELLLAVAQNDQTRLANAIDEVMAKRGEVVIEDVVAILAEKAKDQYPELAEIAGAWANSQKVKSAA